MAKLRNKLDKREDAILCANMAKKVGIAIVMAMLFNEVSAQKKGLYGQPVFNYA